MYPLIQKMIQRIPSQLCSQTLILTLEEKMKAGFKAELTKKLKILLMVTFSGCVVVPTVAAAAIDKPEAPVQADATQNDCVVLLHGLARSHHSMTPLKKSLSHEGYYVVNSEYNSLDAPIEQLAPRAIDSALGQRPQGSNEIHFVTHSLGGILVRQYLQQAQNVPPNQRAKIGRVVMLGPPNQGSELVDKFVTVPGFNKLNGFAGRQLGTDDNSKPNNLKDIDVELGIIAGSKSINPILSLFLPGQDDGKVTIESTKLDGMKDHLILPTTHTFMMRNAAVLAQVNYFLANGQFEETQID